jgi:hypothetical protein
MQDNHTLKKKETLFILNLKIVNVAEISDDRTKAWLKW